MGNDALNTVIERDPAAPMFRIFSIASRWEAKYQRALP